MNTTKYNTKLIKTTSIAQLSQWLNSLSCDLLVRHRLGLMASNVNSMKNRTAFLRMITLLENMLCFTLNMCIKMFWEDQIKFACTTEIKTSCSLGLVRLASSSQKELNNCQNYCQPTHRARKNYLNDTHCVVQLICCFWCVEIHTLRDSLQWWCNHSLIHSFRAVCVSRFTTSITIMYYLSDIQPCFTQSKNLQNKTLKMCLGKSMRVMWPCENVAWFELHKISSNGK